MVPISCENWPVGFCNYGLGSENQRLIPIKWGRTEAKNRRCQIHKSRSRRFFLFQRTPNVHLFGYAIAATHEFTDSESVNTEQAGWAGNLQIDSGKIGAAGVYVGQRRYRIGVSPIAGSSRA